MQRASQSLRILHVIFSSRMAGSERYCVDLANRQAALGHEVHVAGARGSPVARALAPSVRFHGMSRFFRSLFLRRLVAGLGADICHGHLSAACKALGGLGDQQQTVATLHVGYKPHQHSRLGGLICVNRAQATRLAGYPGQVRTIPNWLPKAPAAVPAPGLRAELGLRPGVFLVGAVGRLHPSKGMDVLVSAFRAAAPADAALVILGEGPQQAQLERLRAGDRRIHLVGFRASVHACLRELEGPGEYLLDQPVELVLPGSVEAIALEIGAAYERFRTGGLRRLAYDLTPFDPADRVADVAAFYGDVIEARQWSRTRQARSVAVAT